MKPYSLVIVIDGETKVLKQSYEYKETKILKQSYEYEALAYEAECANAYNDGFAYSYYDVE